MRAKLDENLPEACNASELSRPAAMVIDAEAFVVAQVVIARIEIKHRDLRLIQTAKKPYPLVTMGHICELLPERS